MYIHIPNAFRLKDNSNKGLNAFVVKLRHYFKEQSQYEINLHIARIAAKNVDYAILEEAGYDDCEQDTLDLSPYNQAIMSETIEKETCDLNKDLKLNIAFKIWFHEGEIYGDIIGGDIYSQEKSTPKEAWVQYILKHEEIVAMPCHANADISNVQLSDDDYLARRAIWTDILGGDDISFMVNLNKTCQSVIVPEKQAVISLIPSHKLRAIYAHRSLMYKRASKGREKTSYRDVYTYLNSAEARVDDVLNEIFAILPENIDHLIF